MLSETGFNWELEQRQYVGQYGHSYNRLWAGGWPSFKQGLSWWNTWLCWLTRNAPTECNIDAQHTLHACVHNPTTPPYVTETTSDALPGYPTTWSLGGYRNQWFYNFDAWGTYYYPNAPTINVPGLIVDGRYETSFSVFNSTSWNDGIGNRDWRIGPFGACFKVWADVGGDPVTTDLNTGWVLSTQAGVAGEKVVSLPAGYGTIYFPIIKRDIGAYPNGDQFTLNLFATDGSGLQGRWGNFFLNEMPDSQTFSNYDPDGNDGGGFTPVTQSIYSAMVYPFVYYSSVPRQVRVQIWRGIAGPRIYFGRPVVLPQACSWFITQ